MSLRSQLEEILPNILPDNPKEAIKGPELIKLTRALLNGEYSDASLRYHFSSMSAEAQPLIAKVDRGQGYYRCIPRNNPLVESRAMLPLFTDMDFSRMEEEMEARAIALAVRSYDTMGRGVFLFHHEKDHTASSWDTPDMIVVDWPAGDWNEAGALLFDRVAQERCRLLGTPLVALQSICVAFMSPAHQLRQHFFRALACSSVAHRAVLLLVDEKMPTDSEASALRSLSEEYGVDVEYIELTSERLEEMPSAEEILRAEGQQRDTLLEGLDPVKIAIGKMTSRHIENRTVASKSYNQLFSWISTCLSKGKVEPHEFLISNN